MAYHYAPYSSYNYKGGAYAFNSSTSGPGQSPAAWERELRDKGIRTWPAYNSKTENQGKNSGSNLMHRRDAGKSPAPAEPLSDAAMEAMRQGLAAFGKTGPISKGGANLASKGSDYRDDIPGPTSGISLIALPHIKSPRPKLASSNAGSDAPPLSGRTRFDETVVGRLTSPNKGPNSTACPLRYGSNILYVGRIPSCIQMQQLVPRLSHYGFIDQCLLSPAGYAFVKYDNRLSVTHACGFLNKALCRSVWPELERLFYDDESLVVGKATGQSDSNTLMVYDSRWSEHIAPDGTSYFYDCIKQESQWDAPKILLPMLRKAQEEMRPWVRNMTEDPPPDLPAGTALFVSHLPKTWTENVLRTHFEAFGELTFCALQEDNEGDTRGFGYVGYETREEAEAAQRGMHNYHVENRRLHVEIYHNPEVIERGRGNWNSVTGSYSLKRGDGLRDLLGSPIPIKRQRSSKKDSIVVGPTPQKSDPAHSNALILQMLHEMM